jgi:hypothetical protein
MMEMEKVLKEESLYNLLLLGNSMKKTILAALIAGVITTVIITQTVSLTISMDVSASVFCQISKDGSEASPGCAGSRGECNKDLAEEHKDFKCVGP